MIINTLIPLEQAQRFPARQVGQKSLDLSKLIQGKIAVSPGFIIPSETLKQIAHHNSLRENVNAVRENADWSNDFTQKKNQQKIDRLIKKQTVPENISKEIHKAYKKHIGNNFARVFSSGQTVENIKGEANLIESILEIWALTNTDKDVVSQPILVLAQKQPTASGIAQINRQHKNKIIIQAQWGVLSLEKTQPDFFEIDMTSQAIVTRHLNPQKNIYIRDLDKLRKTKNKHLHQPSLSDTEAKEVAQLVVDVNRKFIGNRNIHFEIDKSGITVTNLKKQAQFSHQDESGVVLMGNSITSGHIEAFTQIIDGPSVHNPFLTGNILVKKQLNDSDLSLINQASAVLVEANTIDRNILKTIIENHIPCIIGVNFATKKLTNNTRVVVDASDGKVYLPDSNVSKQKSEKTITKLYLSAGNPFIADKYSENLDGIFIKGDFASAYLGSHPYHLLKTKSHLFEKNLYKSIEAFATRKPRSLFYRLCNLNSHELSSLKFGPAYEKEELNPYLGTRGALKIMENSTLFEAEVKVVSQLASKEKKTINLVLPFVRTVSELAILLKKLDKLVTNRTYLKYWLQLNTPANILNLKEFLQLPIDGITFQSRTIHDLAYGIDPDNPELTAHYPFDAGLMSEFLDKCVFELRNRKSTNVIGDGSIPLIVKMNNYQADFVASAVKHSVRAIVVKPQHLDIVKRQVLNTEEKLLTKN